jgi:sporulation protein YlmC with PRC-barrel domain
MRNQLTKIMAVSAACLALNMQAQNSSTSSSTGTGSTGSSTDQSSQPNYHSGRQYGGAGRMGHQEVRASKLMGADVKTSQGQSLGTINDVIFNPASGRIDFAVISLSSTAGNESTGSTSSTTSTTPGSTTSASTTGTTAGKLVPVPWMLLRPAGAPGATTSSTESQQTFTFSGDTSKLQSAPSFDQSNWPDITQFSWRQSIYSHFGMTPGSATGGATSPGGAESSTGTSSSGTSSSGTGSTSPDSSSSSSTTPSPSGNPPQPK